MPQGPPQGDWRGPLQRDFHNPQIGFPTPVPAPRRNKKALLITAGATGAVLLIVAVVVGIVSFSGGGAGGIGGGGASTATDAVKGYLDALSKGDANAALAFGSDQPASKDFLTDDVLKQQIAKWPITNIRILNANETGDMAQVHVVANFGDQTSDQTLMVKKQDGGWKLSGAAAKINLTASALTTNPVTGQPLPAPPVSLFGKPISVHRWSTYFPVGWSWVRRTSTSR
ncbi:Lumazine-binding domain protein [Mycolicibacterium conceptionense]|uniref:Lumazine-binding domain protein n=1 Tax=Mycolicibacterium conceptionense TaxID=451644 RepID=A0A0U1DA54_9MYCO|nr:Lumazine-binding domain protein [Mycolicibacterium conceptionense]